MALWDQVPDVARSSGLLEQLRPLLESLSEPTATDETDADGTWRTYAINHTAPQPLTFGPGAGGFGSSAGSSSTPVEIGRTTRLELGLHLTGSSPDGGWRFTVTAPDARVRLPFLRGAELDAQGQLRANGQPVTFTLPSLRLRVQQLAGQAAVPQLVSASTSGTGTDALYDFLRMDPPYALVGPSDVVGFAFRTAVLDLSGTAGPGVPAGARAMPADWQGFWLPEARLFVAPSGLEGIAVSAGVRDLWIGLGVHAGVTGTFEAEVVNRGATPTIAVGFRTPSGRYLPDPGPAPAPALVPEHATLVVDASGGIAPVSVSISVDGVTTDGDRVDLTVPGGTTRTVVITARDGSANPPATRTLTVQHDPGAAAGGGSPLDAITVTPTSTTSHTVTRVPSTADEVVLRLEPQVPAVWTWPGGGSGSAVETVTVPVAAGQTLDVQAVVPPTRPQAIDAYFLFAQPGPFNGNTAAAQRWAENGSNLRVARAAGRDVPGDPRTVRDTLPARLTEIGAGTELRVTGYASWEGSLHDGVEHATYNQALSERRRDALVHLLGQAGFTNVVSEPCQGFTAASSGTAIDPGPPPPPGDPAWWRARATTVGNGSTTCTARVERVAPPPQREVDRQPPPARRPDCFRRIGVRVELLRGTFIGAEVYGEFDIETAVEGSLARRGQPALRSGARPNPLDGVCRFLVRLRIAEDRDSWLVSAEFRAAEGDLDGLAEMTRAGANTTAIDVLGAVSVLAPLSSGAAELSPAAGALVALGTVALGASTLIQVQRIVLRGGELVVSQGTIAPDGSATVDRSGNAVSVLLDVEVVFSFDLGIVRVDPATPVSTRYQAVGVRTSWNTAGSATAPEFLPIPVFDPSRGYSLDIPAGAVTASPPMHQILRVLGFRVSRDNPTFLEVEVGIGLDLGIVKVDTVRVRARLDGPLDITLTKLAASLEIPGTLHGSGSLEFTPLGFKGSFDLTIIPTNIRGRATLSVETDDAGVTGVLVGADIEFPVPLLLGASGLGIFGFLGGVGINYQRNEAPYAASQVPALGWLTDQLARGHVMDGAGWTHTAGAYAVAAGVLLGTVEGGFVAHLKGIVLVEVPGPRLLLVMKADVLKMPPVLKDASATATFLAVLDVDFGRGTITLGIVAVYEIKHLLKIRVPVTGFFNTELPEDWFIDLGRYDDRVTVEVLDVITGSGYLMVHGNGLAIPGLPPVTGGLAIATGFHISAVLMGSKAASLYLEVAAGFDAILGFDPFFLAGTIYARGELRLFVVSIAASAELTVLVGRLTQTSPDITYVHGRVCGKVDLFFFDVEGCVELTIGSMPPETLTPPDLVAGVSLVSRSPALVEGSGTERAIDAKLADAVKTSESGALPSVPLDAIPVVLFRTGPRVQPASVLGETPLGNPGTQEWVRLGDRWWAYDLTGVTLTGPLQPAGGKTPSSWWKQGAPADPAVGPALALLNWLPTPFSRALPYGESLTTTIEDRWGTVCSPAAPPAWVLWTFDGKPLGPSRAGWELQGVPWPDPPGTVRTQPVQAPLAVSEPWRCGDAVADALHGTTPAVVVGDAVSCKLSQRAAAGDPLQAWTAEAGAAMSNRVVSTQGEAAWEAVAQALAGGVSLSDLSATWQAEGWEPGLRGGDDCDGRILRAPLHDSLEPAPRGTAHDEDRVRTAWAQTRHVPVELRDAVRLVPDSGASELKLLLLVPEEVFVDRLVVHFLKEDGSLQHEHRLDGGDRVGSGRTIPSPWFDPGGPWADPVSRAGLAAGRIAAAAGYPQVLVLVEGRDLPEGGSVLVGWDTDEDFQREAERPAFHVVAMTGLVTSEARRFDWDTQVVTSEQSALSAALTQNPDDHALLVPGETYTVAVSWRAASVKQDGRPTGAPASWPHTQTDSYRFVADGPAKAPKDLGPWVLTSSPGHGDIGVLCDEPIRIVLATQNVGALFDAYGQELRVLVHAASGKHPEPPGGGTDPHFSIPLEPGPFLTVAGGLWVQTPWETALREVLLDERQACVDTIGEGSRHLVLTLPYDLEPLTDYLVDVHAVAKDAPASARNLVHRIAFTTSAFGRIQQLAGLLREARWRHGPLPSRAPLDALPPAPTGDQLDAAFQQAGLDVPRTPAEPLVQVLWSQDPVPVPLAAVVECTEPMWRSRLVPTVVQAPVDAVDPTHMWWAARPGFWMELEPSELAAAPGALPQAAVTRIVPGPGGARAVVLLEPDGRGKRLALDLVLPEDLLAETPTTRVLAVDVPLTRAPWEEEL